MPKYVYAPTYSDYDEFVVFGMWEDPIDALWELFELAGEDDDPSRYSIARWLLNVGAYTEGYDRWNNTQDEQMQAIASFILHNFTIPLRG